MKSLYMRSLKWSRRKYDQKRNKVFISSLWPMPAGGGVCEGMTHMCVCGGVRSTEACLFRFVPEGGALGFHWL